jgi:hypothetical protein
MGISILLGIFADFFFFAHCAVLLITFCHFVLFFLWPLCCIADPCLSLQTVISNTAQWPKEKKDKMTNSDQQYSTMGKEK